MDTHTDITAVIIEFWGRDEGSAARAAAGHGVDRHRPGRAGVAVLVGRVLYVYHCPTS